MLIFKTNLTLWKHSNVTETIILSYVKTEGNLFRILSDMNINVSFHGFSFCTFYTKFEVKTHQYRLFYFNSFSTPLLLKIKIYQSNILFHFALVTPLHQSVSRTVPLPELTFPVLWNMKLWIYSLYLIKYEIKMFRFMDIAVLIPICKAGSSFGVEY